MLIPGATALSFSGGAVYLIPLSLTMFWALCWTSLSLCNPLYSRFLAEVTELQGRGGLRRQRQTFMNDACSEYAQQLYFQRCAYVYENFWQPSHWQATSPLKRRQSVQSRRRNNGILPDMFTPSGRLLLVTSMPCRALYRRLLGTGTDV